MGMYVELKDIVKRYNDTEVLKGISFNLKPGEITGFIGPNGAGKTTTMKIITGLVKPDEGTVRVLGKEFADSPTDAKRCIGYLPENNPLYEDMYVREYLSYVYDIYKIKEPKRECVADIIDRTGLGAEQHKKIRELSKGYKQRVGLAQAMIHDPKVLILDEPTTGLDPKQLIEIRRLIKELGRDRAVMLSTHIMQEVEAICDRIMIINKGEICVDDRAEKIIENARSGGLFEIVAGFEGAVNTDSLRGLPGVTAVKIRVDGLAEITATADIRRELFDFAVKERVRLIELRLQTRGLESVFLNYTK